MKRLFTKMFLCAGMFSAAPSFAANLWQEVSSERAPKNLQVMHPTAFKVFTVDEENLKMQMWNLSERPEEGMVVTLPMPDGSSRDFNVWQTPIMPQELAAKYADIRTYTAYALNDKRVTAKLEFTLYGFTAMIYDGDNTSFVDPYDNYHTGYYMVHYKRDEVRAPADRMKCEVGGDEIAPAGEDKMEMDQSHLPKLAQRTFNGHNIRAYRAAICCSHQYASAATGLPTPTIPQTFAKMTITLNRVNGVYNREFSVQMNFCANEDTLIWNVNTGGPNGNDPFNTINSNGNACLSANQTQCTNRIGSANYDFGHVFTTGGGGVSSLGVVCNNGMKGQSVTGSPTPVGDGYDIDYVAHEMGHEFGSNHTFNDNTNGSCGGNAVFSCAFEPGSGATIMDYAGICTGDDLQLHSDPYFSASSLMQIQAKLAGSENACAVITTSGNKLVYMPAFSANYTIPYKTPFELTGPTAVDSVADTAITYGWTQWNLGDFNKACSTTFFKGPIFRSYNPEYDPTRVFPKLSWLLTGSLTNVTAENAMGEKVPDTARYLTFKMVVRNILNGNGCFLFPDDTMHLDAVQTTTKTGFKVTSQGTVGVSYTGGSTQTVTWDVVGTNAAPVSAANVDIYMSKNAGVTWPYFVGTFPNNGSATVTIMNPAASSSSCRFKVKGSGNVFFNLNLKNFTVSNNTAVAVDTTGGGSGGGSAVAQVPAGSEIKIFPIPASGTVHITTGISSKLDGVVYNAVGQAVWAGEIAERTDISVATWVPGVYYARFTEAKTGLKIVRSFVIQ